jgi:hypothetical protein
MNRDNIEELRLAIKSHYEEKIAELQKEMDDALSLISKVEINIVTGWNKQATLPLGDNYTQVKERNIQLKSIPERMNTALSKMLGVFTRQQLFEEILSDGGIEVSGKSIAPVFSKFVNDGKILVVTCNVGKKAGTYQKAQGVPVN